jgi:Tfp pilus assembly protein PilO
VNDELDRKFPWQTVAAAVVVCVGLTAAAYALGVGPLRQRHADAEAAREVLRERRAEGARVAASVAELQRELAGAKAEMERSPLRLQPAVRVNQRLEAIAWLASECGLALDEMRPGTPSDSTHYQTVPIRIVGAGGYAACATFLRRLRVTFGDMGVRTFDASNNAITPTAAPSAMFQAELVWFTEPPRK